MRAAIASAILALLLAIAPSTAMGKVYINIDSPQRALPIAIQEFDGPSGLEISDIVKDDLDFTGLFYCMERDAFIEKPGEQFRSRNWLFLRVEAVLKGSVRIADGKLTAEVSLHEVYTGLEVFRKKYTAPAELVRPMAHSIAGDVYDHITGGRHVFKTKVAYITDNGGKKTLNIMDWDGHRNVDVGISSSLLMTPHWSPDTTKLVYSSERNYKWGIYLLDFDRRREKLLYSVEGTHLAGDFLPDGGSFAFSSSAKGTPDIYMFELNGSKVTRLTSSRGIEVSPSISPDGKTIAFVSDMSGSPQIYLMDEKGYNNQRLTFVSSYNTSPAWSPDGKRLVFVRRHEGRNHIFTMNPDGSDVMQLTEHGNNEDPSFSPDGRYIVFCSDREGTKGIYIMRANGEAQKRITPKGRKAFGPRWSPYIK